ncbi:MAG: hypothetical protein Q8N02_08535 [Methylotenera sp.]|nr:hypothetical protein [Methylotenera sp.]MDP3095610.1 hypothetical protein [Methylotenera sp.]
MNKFYELLLDVFIWTSDKVKWLIVPNSPSGSQEYDAYKSHEKNAVRFMLLAFAGLLMSFIVVPSVPWNNELSALARLPNALISYFALAIYMGSCISLIISLWFYFCWWRLRSKLGATD